MIPLSLQEWSWMRWFWRQSSKTFEPKTSFWWSPSRFSKWFQVEQFQKRFPSASKTFQKLIGLILIESLNKYSSSFEIRSSFCIEDPRLDFVRRVQRLGFDKYSLIRLNWSFRRSAEIKLKSSRFWMRFKINTNDIIWPISYDPYYLKYII